jgi:hypothetical protein
VSAVGHHTSGVRIPNYDSSFFTARGNELVLSTVDKAEHRLLMQVECLMLVLEVDIVEMDQGITTRGDDGLKI